MKEYHETSIGAVFQNRARKYQEKPCVAYKKDGSYADISWNDMNRMVKSLGRYLLTIGVKKGDRVAIFSPNRYEWWVADQAALAIGAADVPIYATNSAEEARYVLGHSGAGICFVASKEHLEKILRVRDDLPSLRTIVTFEKPAESVDGVHYFADTLRAGEAAGNQEEFESRLASVGRNDLATIIYTSGTTGDPKGVMLSHGNFLSNVDQLVAHHGRVFTVSNPEEYVILSFLPLSHAFERTCSYYLGVHLGCKTAFAEDFSTIVQNMNEVRPHAINSVPRLFEKIHAAVISGAGKASGLKKAIMGFALNTARKNLPYVCADKKPGGLFALRLRIAEDMVFSKLKKGLGMDRLLFTTSGGGPLAGSDAAFFNGIGIPVAEGYGLTETSPVATTSYIGNIKPGSVGTPLKNTEVRIADDGEVLIKGPQVMMGYFRNDEATGEVFTADGFFKSGDTGTFDDEGRLHITGRIKDIIITSGGKNISPQNIENSLKASLFIEQAAVVGDGRKFLSALIVPNFAELGSWAASNNIEYRDNAALIREKAVIDLYTMEIEKNMKSFSKIEQIRRFTLLDAEWLQETGELTPTLKVKRRVVEKKYSKEIESMYGDKAVQ